MKVRRLTLTLTLATLFVVALVAIPLIAQEQQECNPDEKWKKTCSHVQVFGNGKVEKPDNVVKAKAQCRANQVIDQGWSLDTCTSPAYSIWGSDDEDYSNA